jgi:hypothetical protein
VSYSCMNPKKAPHQHATFTEGRACWFPPSNSLAPTTGPATASLAPAMPTSGPTPAQLSYVEKLNGDVIHAGKLTRRECSAYIDRLKKEKPVSESALDPRLPLVTGMLASIEDGYYAVRKEEGDTVTFLRLSTPKTGKFANTRKIQTVHGSGYADSGRLEMYAVLWPSGKWSFYRNDLVVERLLLLVADPQGNAMRYAQLIERCQRCNALLTDERSRYYGIGPECEKLRPWVIERKDEAVALGEV